MTVDRHVIECALEPKNTRDHERLAQAFREIAMKDSRFSISTDRESGYVLARAASEFDLNECVDMLLREYGLEVNVGAPGVVYLETLGYPATIRHTHKKVFGGSGQFADVTIAFEPLPPGMGFVFECAAGTVPQEFVGAVEKGLRAQKESGLLAGFPVADFKARLIDATYHEVDSSEFAFDIAARAAFRKLHEQGVVILLEPVMRVEVVTPDDYLGGVIGDINSRRGAVKGTESRGAAFQLITATVPLANMFGYDMALNSMTQRRARYSMTFERYERAPSWNDGGDDTFPGAMALRA